MIPTQILIKLVQDRGCLWNRTHPGYKDSKAKRSAWYEIFREFEPAYETLKPAKKKFIRRMITRKWYNARDSYVKYLRSGTQNRPYLYSDDLKFLDAIYLGYRDPQSLQRQGSIELESDEIDAADDVEHNFERELESESLEAKRPRLEDTKEINIVSVLASLLHKEDDDDRAFFKSITPAVKMLSESSKLKFRVQVMKLINSLKVKDATVTLKVERVSEVDSETE